MSPIEIAMQLQRKHIIIGAGIVFCGLWLCLVAYFLFGEKTPAPVNPGAVAVRSASPLRCACIKPVMPPYNPSEVAVEVALSQPPVEAVVHEESNIPL